MKEGSESQICTTKRLIRREITIITGKKVHILCCRNWREEESVNECMFFNKKELKKEIFKTILFLLRPFAELKDMQFFCGDADFAGDFMAANLFVRLGVLA